MPSNHTNEITMASVVLDTGGGLRSCAKRYTVNNGSAGLGNQQITLLFAHGLGFHKEQWEPVIYDLFQADAMNAVSVIKEAWAVDCQDHGESASLNEDVLLGASRCVSCCEYAGVFLSLLRSGQVDLKTRIVFIGHSAGAISGVLSATGFGHLDVAPYDSMILVEPTMLPKSLFDTSLDIRKGVRRMIESSRKRRDIWSSVSDARSWLRTRTPWSAWDARVLDIYVNSGMRSLPTGIYPEIATGVTLCFPKSTQAMAYNNLQDQHDGLEQLGVLCSSSKRVHVIFGGRIDFNPKVVHDDIIEVVERYGSGSIVYLDDVKPLCMSPKHCELVRRLRDNPWKTAICLRDQTLIQNSSYYLCTRSLPSTPSQTPADCPPYPPPTSAS